MRERGQKLISGECLLFTKNSLRVQTRCTQVGPWNSCSEPRQNIDIPKWVRNKNTQTTNWTGIFVSFNWLTINHLPGKTISDGSIINHSSSNTIFSILIQFSYHWISVCYYYQSNVDTGLKSTHDTQIQDSSIGTCCVGVSSITEGQNHRSRMFCI